MGGPFKVQGPGRRTRRRAVAKNGQPSLPYRIHVYVLQDPSALSSSGPPTPTRPYDDLAQPQASNRTFSLPPSSRQIAPDSPVCLLYLGVYWPEAINVTLLGS